jgi:hypothetical protein
MELIKCRYQNRIERKEIEMGIMLGNQTPEQIEKRLRISLSDEHKEELISM